MNNKDKSKAVMNVLKNEFKALKVERDYNNGGIYVKFMKNGKKGDFVYSFFGNDCGIEDCSYDEDDGEDIYADINNWVSENIYAYETILYKGKKLK